jgi:phage FluMu protein Com
VILKIMEIGRAALPSTPDGGELRCACGSLLARVVDGHLELKCRRCRRAAVVALDRLDGTTGVVVHLVMTDAPAKEDR